MSFSRTKSETDVDGFRSRPGSIIGATSQKCLASRQGYPKVLNLWYLHEIDASLHELVYLFRYVCTKEIGKRLDHGNTFIITQRVENRGVLHDGIQITRSSAWSHFRPL
jgi:hypothetical protein